MRRVIIRKTRMPISVTQCVSIIYIYIIFFALQRHPSDFSSGFSPYFLLFICLHVCCKLLSKGRSTGSHAQLLLFFHLFVIVLKPFQVNIHLAKRSETKLYVCLVHSWQGTASDDKPQCLHLLWWNKKKKHLHVYKCDHSSRKGLSEEQNHIN